MEQRPTLGLQIAGTNDVDVSRPIVVHHLLEAEKTYSPPSRRLVKNVKRIRLVQAARGRYRGGWSDTRNILVAPAAEKFF